MSKETYLIESLTRDLVIKLMEERGLGMREAIDKVFRSRTYAALSNTKSGLYFQSSNYVYDELLHE